MAQMQGEVLIKFFKLFFKANSKDEAPEALGILRVASCLRHSKSQYTAGIMNLIGLGVPQDKSQV